MKSMILFIKGIIIGKPMNEKFYDEYKEIYKKLFNNIDTPILYNVNFGHSAPRCIMPYDAETIVDFDNKKIVINSPIFENKKINIKDIKSCK